MEQLPGGYTLEIPQGCFPLSTDTMVLSAFVRLPPQANVLDLCAGCGTLGLLLCSRDPKVRVTGVEIEETAHRAAQQNITRNGLGNRMTAIRADIAEAAPQLPAGSFHCCTANPPYFSGGYASASLPTARKNDTCSTDTLMKAAARALKFGGDFYVVQKADRLADLIARGACHGLEAKRLALVRHSSSCPVSLVCLQLRKGGRPGLALEEIILYDSMGKPTEAFRQIYHL